MMLKLDDIHVYVVSMLGGAFLAHTIHGMVYEEKVMRKKVDELIN